MKPNLCRHLVALMLFAASCLSLASTIAAGKPAEPPVEFTIDTLDDGRFDLAQQRGNWVVVNFWATWCSPCLKEMPELAAFDAAHDNASVIGLAFEEIETDDMRAFLKERPAGYPIAIVDTYEPPMAFDVPRGLPMTYLIGPDGRVAKRFLGPVTQQDLERAIGTECESGFARDGSCSEADRG